MRSYGTYCGLWLFSACAYKLTLQETMCPTDNARLTSGIIVATPSMRKNLIAKCVIDRYIDRECWTNDKNGDDRRPSVRDSILHESVIRGHHISKGYGLQEQERLYKFDKKQETLMIEMLWLCSKPMAMVGHVPSSFLLNSLGQQSLLTLLGP